MSDSTRIEELRKEIESHCGNCDRPNKEQLGELILSSMAYGFSVGLKAPSADRPQGEWIKDNLGTVICSECKRPRRDNRIGHVNFCNSCGARMKGVDDETD